MKETSFKVFDPSVESAKFFFVKDKDLKTVWVSEYKAEASVITDKIKALGTVYAHEGRFGEHTDYISGMEKSQDISELGTVFEVSFDIEDPDSQSTYEDGFIFMYAQNQDTAKEKLKSI